MLAVVLAIGAAGPAGAAGIAQALGDTPPDAAALQQPPLPTIPAPGAQRRLLPADASPDVRYLRQWIEQRNDSGSLPFAIVDKKQARVHVFDDRHALVGSSAALTGAMPGDASLPGVGERAQTSRLAFHERTTPAGRFPSQPGYNTKGEDIVWFDYDAALAIHRLRPDASYATRAKRLASRTPGDNRASLGCVVVPVEFYERVVRPWLGTRPAIVYVLPDQGPVQAWWPSDAPRAAHGVADDL